MSMQRKQLRMYAVFGILPKRKWGGHHRSRGALSEDELESGDQTDCHKQWSMLISELKRESTDEELSNALAIAECRFLAGIPAILLAASKGDADSVLREIADNRESIFVRQEGTGWGLLHVAARKNNISLCGMLLDIEPSLIDSVDKCGNTALRQAVEFGDTKLVELLATASGDGVRRLDLTGRAVVVYALLAGKIDNVESLLRYDPSLCLNVDSADRRLDSYCDGISIPDQYKVSRLLRRYNITADNQNER